jgi:ribosomal protein S18 acetylase RimI-like enzyme
MSPTMRRPLGSDRTGSFWASCWGILDSQSGEVAELAAPYRHATSDDVPAICQLVEIAGDGLPLTLWANRSFEGPSPWDAAVKPLTRSLGDFARGNTVVREDRGRVTACLAGYALRNSALAYDRKIAPAMIATLQELENIVPETWFANVLATLPEFRGRGFGTELLRIAETLANDSLCASVTLPVSGANTRARRLCNKHGYREKVWQDWLLLVKGL